MTSRSHEIHIEKIQEVFNGKANARKVKRWRKSGLLKSVGDLVPWSDIVKIYVILLIFPQRIEVRPAKTLLSVFDNGIPMGNFKITRFGDDYILGNVMRSWVLNKDGRKQIDTPLTKKVDIYKLSRRISEAG